MRHDMKFLLMGMAISALTISLSIAQDQTQGDRQRVTAGPPGQAPVQRLPGVPGHAVPPRQPLWAPFQLTAEQQAFVDQVLLRWQEESQKIKTFRCIFERREYDPVFLNEGATKPVSMSWGQLTYAKPDKGLFKITEKKTYNSKTVTYEKASGPLEHWVCDGKAVYEFNATQKQLIVRELPPALQGKAIADGPLPFLFSTNAKKLKQRYFIRVTEVKEAEIWLEVFPRHQPDAANFQRVELILDKRRCLPSALCVYLPALTEPSQAGKSRTVYMFQLDGAKMNDPFDLFRGVFRQPKVPWGWKKVVEPASSPSVPRQADRQPAGPGQRQ